MHPNVFLNSFWSNDLRDEVFVAMDFRDGYNERWANIFRPAIETILFDGRPLKAVRVDTRHSGDSILSEIMNGVAHSQLVLADVSVTDRDPSRTGKNAWRNENVMYEVGLALACRQSTEVLLVRDDPDKLLFDISHIPVLQFDPSDVPGSRDKIHLTLCDRLRERELEKDLRVKQVIEQLSLFDIGFIRETARHRDVFGFPGPNIPIEVALSLPNLLAKKVLRLVRFRQGERLDSYDWTDFGRVIADVVAGMPHKRADVRTDGPTQTIRLTV